MIDTIKDKLGRVVAYAEWSLRDKLGLEDKNGEYIFFNHMWVHDDFRHKGMFRRFQRMIEPQVPTARFIYWIRHKYRKDGKERKSLYSERQLFKLRGV